MIRPRTSPVRWFQPCLTCLEPLARHATPTGPVFPEHYRWVEDADGFERLERCPGTGKEWSGA